MRDVPPLEDPEELEECGESDNRTDVRDAGHHRTELAVAAAGTREQRREEKDDEDRGVKDDGTEGDHDDAEETVDRRRRERLDEQVGDREDDGESERRDDLVGEDRAPARARRVRRQLLAGVADALLLETGDFGPRESAVSDPRVGVGARVAAAHPAQELAVVDDEVAERELVRIEEERRDAQRDDRDPEVDDCTGRDGSVRKRPSLEPSDPTHCS